MICPKCGNENTDSSKFCTKCGEKLSPEITIDKKDNTNKIIILATVIAVIVLAGVLLYATGVFGSNIELKTHDFDGFQIDVPTDSNFVLNQSKTSNKKNLFVDYVNKGENKIEAADIQVGNKLTEDNVRKVMEFVDNDGNLRIYKNESNDGVVYGVFKQGSEANVLVYGSDLDVIKEMANSYKDNDFSKIYEKPSTSKQQTQSTQSTVTTQQTSTAASMTILGGSFSTGSSLSDKTYASIYVGTQHSGENVKIQIYYSRDGSTLNNGNMVPKTVDSSGYINVRSADSYKYYPDYAEINIYDTSGNLLDSQSVSLSPSSGTQYF